MEALTYQRAIRALEKYGYDELLPVLGRKLFEAIGEKCVFVQQYDPFTSVPSAVALEGEQDAYGPAMLSVLEYISRMHGVHIEKETVCFGSWGKEQTEYEQVERRALPDRKRRQSGRGIPKRRKTLCGSVGDACDHGLCGQCFADATLRAFRK